MVVGGCVVLFYSHWATFCLLRGTRPTKELKVHCLGRKHTCWEMLGKARACPIRVRQILVWRVSSCPWADDDWRVGVVSFGPPVRTEGLLAKGDPRHPVDLSSSLFRGFLVDELHDPRIVCRGWRVAGLRSAGFGLDLVQPPHPFFYGAFFVFLFLPCLGCAGIQLSYLAGHPFHRTNTWLPLRFKTFSTRNNESSDTCTFCTSGS